MLAIERRNAILTALREENHVVVSELAKVFDVSEETVRRDLDKLEKEGLVVKTYGGAVISENNSLELPYVIRKKRNVQAKQKIAELAASIVSDGIKQSSFTKYRMVCFKIASIHSSKSSIAKRRNSSTSL